MVWLLADSKGAGVAGILSPTCSIENDAIWLVANINIQVFNKSS